jgi:hypothetical protein
MQLANQSALDLLEEETFNAHHMLSQVGGLLAGVWLLTVLWPAASCALAEMVKVPYYYVRFLVRFEPLHPA